MKKFVAIPIPFLAIWATFALSHVLEMSEAKWWAVPYIVTSIGAIVISLFGAVALYERLQRDERYNRR